MWNRQSLLIVNVACADLIVATIGIIFPLVSSIYHRWMFSELACYIYAFTMDFVGTGLPFKFYLRFFHSAETNNGLKCL